MKKWYWAFWIGFSILFFAVLCNIWVLSAGCGRMFDRTETIPKRDVALVLGTSRLTGDGRWLNPHFAHRIEAAAELFRDGRVRHFILSGDNHRQDYDEPTDMKKALMAQGVPATAITLDYAGFRTLDSVVRAKEVFGQTKLVIVSEPFHNARALFLCQRYGIDAVAFNAQPVSIRVSGLAQVRECFARVKAVFDLYLFRTQPRFHGEKVSLSIQ